MTIELIIWKDEDKYSGRINGIDFNKITKETFLVDLEAKIDALGD